MRKSIQGQHLKGQKEQTNQNNINEIIKNKTVKIKLPYEKINFENWYIDHGEECDDSYVDSRRFSYLTCRSQRYIKKCKIKS